MLGILCFGLAKSPFPEVAKGADVSRCATACPDSLKNPVVCAAEKPSLVTSSAMTRSQWFSADTSRDTSRQYQSAQTPSFRRTVTRSSVCLTCLAAHLPVLIRMALCRLYIGFRYTPCCGCLFRESFCRLLRTLNSLKKER